MLAGIKGTLISQFFAEEILFTAFAGDVGEEDRRQAHAALAGWWRRFASEAGPASSVRTLWDRGAVPALQLLGYARTESPQALATRLTARSWTPAAALEVVVAPWGDSIDSAWRAAANRTLGSRWCLCFNGTRLRLVDARSVYTDRSIEFDVELVTGDPRSFAIFWALLRAGALAPARDNAGSLLDCIVAASAAHATLVRRTLQKGVIEALSALLAALAAPSRRGSSKPPPPDALTAAFQASLTAVYRVLFLLFAEARNLVPIWHPVYRRSYTIEALRSALDRPARPRGLWQALQAIAALARNGCTAGDLSVTAFNGRLFAPVPAIDSAHSVREEAVQLALLALCTSPGGRGGRQRIDFRDLGVEQLGAVYEGVLDYEPAWNAEPPGAAELRRGGGERKATGTFYTPRSIAEYLVRRTLHPLVRQATPSAILALRILDPAMGSGAILVAVCHYLASAYEAALVREGACTAGDISDADRCGFRRLIAQRCLFGVDRNQTAVQLARLSLWLTTLAADRPLTFLDHHLRTGDSLVGATPADLARRAPPRSVFSRSRRHTASLPFFEEPELQGDLKAVLPGRIRIAAEPGDSLSAVREKERLLESLSTRDGTLARWRNVADLWCACWFWPDEAPPSPQTFAALADQILRASSGLPTPLTDRLLGTVRQVASREGFFHWVLEFPEAFFEPDGRGLAEPGFDAVVGNPPWEALRNDPGSTSSRRAIGQRTRFIKDCGAYAAQSGGHVNLYQAFVERAVQLVRHGGRIGMVLPSGVLAGSGAGPLRRVLLRRCQTDTLVVFENRDGVFPIHRSVKFALLTSTKGGETLSLACRTGVRDPADLDAIGDTGTAAFPVRLAPRFLERLSGPDLAIPELRDGRDTALLDRIGARFRPLGAPDGWGLAFGRELNATDDAPHFTATGPGVRIVEGKQIDPFQVRLADCRARIPEPALARRLPGPAGWRRARLAYREVAGAANRLTLIAALIPAGVVTTHTVFCLKTPVPPRAQAFLCGLLNSFVANYLVRLFVTTHVTAAALARLRAPEPDPAGPLFREIARLARHLARPTSAWPLHYARLQALAARAYECSETEFAFILETFPLVDRETRERALAAFKAG